MIAAVGPVLLGFLVGFLLRRHRVGTAEHGRFLLGLNFYVCLPALVLPAVASAHLERSLLAFPFAAVVMVLVGLLVGRSVARRVTSSPQDRAVVTTSFMVINCAFALPFVGAVHGPAGIVRVAAFDLVHSMLVATLVLLVAARADPSSTASAGRQAGQVLRTPIVLAMLAGLLLNLAGLPIPRAVLDSLHPFAAASLAVVALGCGMATERVDRWLPLTGIVTTRLATGLATALALSLALGLHGTDRGVLLMLGATPLGFVVVTFAARHGLGTRLGAGLLLTSLALSVSVYAGIGAVTG